MLRRSRRSAFAPGAYVFPGGTLDPGDTSEAALARTAGADERRLTREFRAQPGPLASREKAGLLIAALRELYEEAGVLLLCGSDAAHAARIREARALLQNGTLSFAELLTQLDAYADARALTLFSRWITPPSEPRRYDTHFFVAKAGPDVVADADARETHDGLWIAPAEALERARAGTFALVYPTFKHLERLARFDDVDALVAFARTKPIYSVMPEGTAERGFALPERLEHAW